LFYSIIDLIFIQPPFYNENKSIAYELILNGKPDYKLHNIQISNDAIDLLEKILHKNPKKRLKINQVKTQKFFEEIDYDKLMRYEIEAPFVPNIVNSFYFIAY